MSNYDDNPRNYALSLTESGIVSNYVLLLNCLLYMSHDDVRDMLDANELSPRFLEDEDDARTTR